MVHVDDSMQIMSLMREIYEVRYSDLELEHTCCETLLELGTRNDDRYAICYAHTYLGDYYYCIGNFIESEYHLSKARKYGSLYGFQDLLLTNHMFSGHLYKRIGNEQRSLDFYLDGIALAQKTGNPSMESTLYNCIAVIFDSFGDYGEAMKCLEIAYQLQRGEVTDDTSLRRYITLLSNIAEIACRSGMREKAKMYLDEADNLIRTSNIDPLEFSILYIPKVFYADGAHSDELKGVLDELFALIPENWEDKNLAFDLLLSIAKRLLHQKEYAYLEQVLEKLTSIARGTEYANSLALHSLYITLYQQTAQEEKNRERYQRFYNAYLESDEISQEVRTAGLMAKMSLRRTLEEKDMAQARNKILEEAAYYDELTQTYNRRYLNEVLADLRGTDHPRQICVSMIDLDYFKEYNDTYGHLDGDYALRAVAKCLCDHASSKNAIMRYGGDEFASVCFDRTNEEMDAYFDRVRESLVALGLEHKNSRCPAKIVTVSIGYCNGVVQNEAEFEALFAKADKALYISKYKGRNTVTRFE